MTEGGKRPLFHSSGNELVFGVFVAAVKSHESEDTVLEHFEWIPSSSSQSGDCSALSVARSSASETSRCADSSNWAKKSSATVDS